MHKANNYILTLCFAGIALITSNSGVAQSLSWGNVAAISHTGTSGMNHFALSTDGTRATAIWLRDNGSNYVVRSSSAMIDGNNAIWGGISELASWQNIYNPQISLSSDGTRATAVWTRYNGSDYVIQSASATITGNWAAWGTVTDLSTGSPDTDGPQVSLSADGTKATSVWFRNNGSYRVVQSASATISGNTANWSFPVYLSPAGQEADEPQISLSSDGTRATAVWKRYDGSNYIVQSASATIVGNLATWGSITDLSDTGQNAHAHRVSLSSDGAQSTVVWVRKNGIRPGIQTVVQSASATVNGNTATWGASTNLSEYTGYHNRLPKISISNDGTKATAIWYSENVFSANTFIKSASATIAGNLATWSSNTTLTANVKQGGYYDTDISLSSDGTIASTVWTDDSASNEVQSRLASIKGNIATWGSVMNVSGGGQNVSGAYTPEISLSSDGSKATAVWSRWIASPPSNGSITQSASAIEETGSCYVIRNSSGETIVFCL